MSQSRAHTNKWPVFIWLLCVSVAIAIMARARFTADFSAFLPSAPSPEQQLLVDQLQDGVVARMLLIGIEGADASARAEASKRLATQLRSDADFIAINNGEPVTFERDQKYLLDNRYLLSPVVDAQRFSVDGLQAAIDDTLASLASPAGLALKHLLGRDPTGEFLQILEQLNNKRAPMTQFSVWTAVSGQRALLLAQTAAAGSDSDAQAQALTKIQATFAALKNELHASELQIKITGPGAFAVSARDTIRTQAEQLAAFSLLFIVAFLWLIYRSWRLLALGLLPVATAIVVGIAATALWFGNVHGITLGFGSTLVGEAVDYAIYFFVQAQGATLAQWRQHFWPTIRLGVLISLCGFATLLFSGFAGLAQLGLYSIAGLMAAALSARFVLPALTVLPIRIAPALRFGECFYKLLQLKFNARIGLLVLAAIAVAIVYQQRAQMWNDALTALSPITLQQMALDTELRADIGAPDVRFIVALTADSEEHALQQAERASAILQTFVDAGAIAGFDTPSRFLPSLAQQRARQQALPAAENLQRDTQLALSERPLRADKLTEFFRDIAAAKVQAPLTRADLRRTSFALAIDSLLRSNGARWEVLLPLQTVADRELPIAAIREQLKPLGSAAWLLDIKGEAEALYANYFREVLHLSGFGLLVIAGVLAVSLRALRPFVAALVPLLIAVLCVMAALVLAHERLHLLHVIGLFLIVAVGSNYALFFAQHNAFATAPQWQIQTLASLLIANITTVAGFGLLAFSSVPVLHAIGITVAPGAVLALIFSALWSQPNQSSAAISVERAA